MTKFDKKHETNLDCPTCLIKQSNLEYSNLSTSNIKETILEEDNLQLT